MENLVRYKKDAPGPNLSQGTFRKIIIIFWSYAEWNFFEWDQAIFHCINWSNSARAVAVGENTCVRGEHWLVPVTVLTNSLQICFSICNYFAILHVCTYPSCTHAMAPDIFSISKHRNPFTTKTTNPLRGTQLITACTQWEAPLCLSNEINMVVKFQLSMTTRFGFRAFQSFELPLSIFWAVIVIGSFDQEPPLTEEQDIQGLNTQSCRKKVLYCSNPTDRWIKLWHWNAQHN